MLNDSDEFTSTKAVADQNELYYWTHITCTTGYNTDLKIFIIKFYY